MLRTAKSTSNPKEERVGSLNMDKAQAFVFGGDFGLCEDSWARVPPALLASCSEW